MNISKRNAFAFVIIPVLLVSALSAFVEIRSAKATTYSCFYVEDKTGVSNRFHADDGDDTLKQVVHSYVDYGVRLSGKHENGYIIEESTLDYSRSAEGYADNWHPEDSYIKEVVIGYECTDDTEQVIDTQYGSTFDPSWWTNYQTYVYSATNVSSNYRTVPVMGSCGGYIYFSSSGHTDVYKGGAKITDNWTTQHRWECDE